VHPGQLYPQTKSPSFTARNITNVLHFRVAFFLFYHYSWTVRTILITQKIYCCDYLPSRKIVPVSRFNVLAGAVCSAKADDEDRPVRQEDAAAHTTDWINQTGRTSVDNDVNATHDDNCVKRRRQRRHNQQKEETFDLLVSSCLKMYRL